MAFLREGALVTVDDGVVLEKPVQLLFLGRPGAESPAAYPRVLAWAGRNSRLSLIETYAAAVEGVYLTDAVTEMFLAEGAIVEHDRLQSESTQAFHVATMAVRQERSSVLSSNAVSVGGALARSTVTAVLAGEGGECTLNGLMMAAGEQLTDSHTVIDHAAAHCASHELYKSILDGRSRGVFNGKIYVRPGAQKTDAKQTNKTLLLSGDATINTKPQLEIFADDVKCTHGATVGQLNEDQLFYLRARGIGEEEAKELLTFAFASDVVSRIHAAPFRDQLDRLLRARLQAGRIATTP
jgi:Fe-S cluster assembly protein SufD